MVTVGQGFGGFRASTSWGEFVLAADGETVISKTVDTEVLESAVRPGVADGEEIEVAVTDLIAELGESAEVIDNGDGTSTINYKGDYKDNNITLGDLQKATANILGIVMSSNQFANLFDDVESVSYTEARADQLTVYTTVEKSEVQ